MTDPHRVLVIGLDALTPAIAEKWAAEGRLPNIGRFISDGAWGEMRSVPNRNSAAAWSTMCTGLNPGKHGIYWFTEDLPESYSYKFINASYRRGQTMWRILSDEGRRVVVINVPLTYPAEAVNGVAVAGLDAPGVDAPGFTHPPEYAEELIAAAGGTYYIHSGVNLFTDPERKDEGIERLHSSIDARTAATLHAMETQKWDFFMVVFTESDVIQHYMFQQMEEPEASDPVSHRTAVREIYEHLDDAAGKLIASAGENVTVILVSDHGARRDVGLARSLPNWFQQLGLLTTRAPGGTSAVRTLGTKALAKSYRVLDKRLSTEVKHKLSERFTKLRSNVEVAMSYAGVDWSKTLAYTDGKRPEIWINLRGRQPQGIVDPDDYDAVCARIVEALTSAMDDKTGEPVIAAVHRRDRAYSGPFVDRSPDLIVEWSERGSGLDIRYPDGRKLRLDPGHLDDPVAQHLNGGHSQHGVIGLRGAGVGRTHLDDVQIADIAPTVLFLLGAPVPADVDGSVIKQALDESLSHRAARVGDSSDLTGGDSGTGYSEQDESEIRERLQALGYVD